MELVEKMLSREEIFSGKVLHVVRDTVQLPNGSPAEREICIHNGAVCIIPLLSDGRVIMERQYRYAHSRVFYEIPAGKLDTKDEPPLEAAMRELKEETGATAGRMTFLGEIDTSPALVSERIYMYLAEELEFGERKLDDDEFLTVEYESLASLYNKVLSGEIRDAKTQVAILKVAAIYPELISGDNGGVE